MFATLYRYPGVPAVASLQGSEEYFLYEWDEGTLKSIGSVPGPGLEVPVGAVPGGIGLAGGIAGQKQNFSRAVSVNGSRVFFSAERQDSPNSAEVGKIGVFVRENGISTRDVSLSETETPDKGAKYESAAENGSRVFFTANAGLTAETSAEGTDLYEYDLGSEALSDLSVDHDPRGAEVAGFIGSSADGSHVYFVARGQLVPGRGMTFAENVSAGTFSIYGEADGVVSYVGPGTAPDVSTLGLVVGEQRVPRSAFVSPDGRYLLFQSSANVTGYVSGGAPEAYLFDSRDKDEPIVCASCRQDGKPSITPTTNAPLQGTAENQNTNPLYDRTKLAVRNGKPVVFFTSFDPLAPGGASGGETNLYEWTHDQVFRIGTEPPGLKVPPEPQSYVVFAGVSADAEDLYFMTPSALTWEDGDGRLSVYDARIRGGFPQPAPPAPPCSSTIEGSCSGPSLAAPPSAPGAGSATFMGPGNPKHKRPKHHKKKRRKHRKHHEKQHTSMKSARKNHGQRRAGK